MRSAPAPAGLALHRVTTANEELVVGLTPAQLARLRPAGPEAGIELAVLLEQQGYLAVWQCTVHEAAGGARVELVRPLALGPGDVVRSRPLRLRPAPGRAA